MAWGDRQDTQIYQYENTSMLSCCCAGPVSGYRCTGTNHVQCPILDGKGNYTEAAKCLRPLADGGNAEAQTLAAQLFFEGKGVTKNEAQGVKYATQAAKQGHEDSDTVTEVFTLECQPGDMDEDGRISVGDITRLIEQYLHQTGESK
ncbi:MAG: sel1 repeat family protein [Bacteroidaceae bacterium]|nr:sel1 repeat family protein [Bacteroidaceae bacterium]